MSTRHIIMIVLVAVALLCAAGIYYFYDPSLNGFFPRCPFLSITGWRCPGCGSQRAIHAILHGDLATAWHFNAMMVVSLPVLAVYTFAEFTRSRFPRFYCAVNKPAFIWGIFIAVIAWWLSRNIFGW